MKRSRTLLPVLISSVFLLAMLGACSGGSSQEGAAPTDSGSSTPSAEGSAATLITADGELLEPEPPPPEFLDILLEETEGDPEAREEAILEALRLVLGEGDAEAPYGAETTFDLGWMFTSIASGVYEESENADFKTEFEDLMARVFPIEERMLPYAAEDAVSASGGHAAVRVDLAYQELDCRVIRARGFPPRGSGDPPICQLYRQFIAGGQKFNVWFPVENRGNASFMAYVEAAGKALMDSQAAYSAYSDVPGVNLVFTTLPNPTNARVWASVPFKWLAGDVGTTYCPISVFPRATALPVDDFKQTIAHEVFHCVTYERRAATFSEAANWYMEGMAEHFSNVVYPKNNLEIRKHLYYLDSRSPTDSFLSFKYISWIFFQYLENEYGNSYNMALLDGLPARGGRSDQARALAAFDDMQTIFHEFGQAYLNKEIMDSSRAPIPNTVYYLRDLDYDVREGATLALFSETMVLTRYRLQFGDGQEYDLLKDFSGQDGMLTWRLEDEEAFRDVPENMAPQCGEPENYIMLFTSLTPDGSYGGTADLDMEVEKAENGRMDCCLVGTWEQPASQNRSNLETIMSGDVQLVSVSGRAVLVITEERTTYFTPEDYSITARDPDGRLATFTIAGASSGTFILPDDEEGVIESTGEEAAFIMTGTVEGGTVTFPDDIPGFSAEGLSFGYECSATQLISYPGELAPFSSSTYNRVSEVPQTPEPPEDLPAPPGGGEEDPSDLAAPKVCQEIAITDFTPGSGSASWTVRNGSTDFFEIVGVSLDWPSENGAWQSAALDDSEFWAGSKPASPDILESGFTGPDTARAIPPGSATLELGFANDTVGSSSYILVLDFSNGCLVADVR